MSGECPQDLSHVLDMRQILGTWYSCPQNRALVSTRLTHAIMTPHSWVTRIRQTREPGHQADKTDVLAMALMLQIQIKILSSVPERDMAFNIQAGHERVITHLDLPHKQHWIDTVPLHAASTAASVLDLGDKEHALIASYEGLGPESGSLAVNTQDSVVADLTGSALSKKPHSDHRLRKRRKETESVEVGCGTLTKTAHKEARLSSNCAGPAERAASSN